MIKIRKHTRKNVILSEAKNLIVYLKRFFSSLRSAQNENHTNKMDFKRISPFFSPLCKRGAGGISSFFSPLCKGEFHPSTLESGLRGVLFLLFFIIPLSFSLQSCKNPLEIEDNIKIIEPAEPGIDFKDWEVQKSGSLENLNAVYFIDAMNGWIVGNKATILRTNDGGATWTKQDAGFINPNSSNDLHSVMFINKYNGWAVGKDALTIHTTDGGNHWKLEYFQKDGAWFKSIYFTDLQNGWILGSDGKIKRTRDGGANWNLQYSTEGGIGLSRICFLDTERAWAVGNGGRLIRTINAGGKWEEQSLNTFYFLNDICFADMQSSWLVGENGTIFRSQDAGETWSSIEPFTQFNLLDIDFPNPMNGWIIGKRNALDEKPACTIFRTTDGGITWSGARSENDFINAIFFIDSVNGCAVGDKGLILKLKFIPISLRNTL